jgi:DNA-directed RNA polymerase specialized sigma24 family protein
MSDVPRLEEISTRPSVVAEPAALIRCYGPAIRGYLEHLLGQEHGDEVARDFTVRVLQGRLGRWLDSRQGRFRDYLARAVLNAAADFQRRKKLRLREELHDDLSQVPDRGGELTSGQKCWLRLWRQTVVDRARAALDAYERDHPGNVHATLLRLLADEPADTATLGERLRQATGREFTEAHVRKLKERARRQFAERLLHEVRSTLAQPTPEDLEAELRVLGLYEAISEYCSLQSECGA